MAALNFNKTFNKNNFFYENLLMPVLSSGHIIFNTV